MNTAVAFIIFKRPDSTRRVFDSIRQAQPPRLYLVSDGPRPSVPREAELVEETRKLVENVDWPCDVIRIYREWNWGCGDNIVNALDWIFEREDSLIILEDDCLPHPSFYRYCEELLEKYAEEERVMSIGGDRSFPMVPNDGVSFTFSRYPLIWGWATWRRAWTKNGYHRIYSKDSGTGKSVLKPQGPENRDLYQHHDGKRPFEWDYVWRLTLLANRALACVPAENLITNIGYGEFATHTTVVDARANYPLGNIEFPLTFPKVIKEDRQTSRLIERHVHHRRFLKDKIKMRARRYYAGIRRRLFRGEE